MLSLTPCHTTPHPDLVSPPHGRHHRCPVLRMLSTVARRALAGAIQVVRGCGRLSGPVTVPRSGHQTLAAAPLPALRGSPGVRQAQALDHKSLLQSAKARSLLLTDLDVHTGVDRVQLNDNNRVCITWPDLHRSEFEPEWLRARCFSPEARQARQEKLFFNEREFWDSGLQIPTADFEEVLCDDKAALAWLMALRRVGIVYLKGAPVEQGQVARLSQRIGYLRLTFYGHTWQVQDKPLANNVAYTSGKLSLHTDYPALHHPPGVQFLHCLQQAQQGGDSEVVDGFHMAELLRREAPEAFSLLSSLWVDFTDTGSDYCHFYVQSKNRIIDVDSEGRVVRINYNNATRDSALDVPLDQVQPFYSSLKTFVEVMNRPENVVTYRMEPGDLVTFDNWRLLHGRKSYVSDPERPRHLEGAYLDWDEVMSRLRLLCKHIHGDS
ncbi:gamma-butyrobetaine dioxygenase isoform X2 [Brachyhypopomus gauderio]|uniref:gamma-butyrobetaine dioxygenase isoform X2 n=1 Tax=Brachyhypopomus gauderio TaxID=698409 RepID=UPI0040423A90